MELLLYQQLIRPVAYYACPIRSFTARTYAPRLFQSKCFIPVTSVLCYVRSWYVHEDLGVPFFADHVTALTESFESKLADVKMLLIRKIGRHLHLSMTDSVT